MPENLMQAVTITIHLLVVVALPPLLLGVINKTKAFFGGRVGPPVLQVYYDLFKLLRKGSVFSQTTTWVFRFSPVVGLVTALLAALVIPLGVATSPVSFSGDLILFAYLLALGRFFTIVGALDTGSAFEGMGAAREASYSCLAEPILFFGLLVLAKITGTLSMAGILGGSVGAGSAFVEASTMLILASWFIVLLVENCRIPFDDPNTHLELTMIHEVMVLDHSGPSLGMIVYGASIKLFIFASMIVRLALPMDTGNMAIDWESFLAGVLLVVVLIGIIESIMARLRLPVIPNLLVGAGVLSAFGLVLMVSKG